MPASQLDIWNMAISHLGEGVEIGSVTEKSSSARACSRFYDMCRQKALRDAPWPFAKKYALLAQSTDTSVPTSEFVYAYVYPADALQIRRIPNGVSRVEDMQSRIPFNILQAKDGTRIIACDVPPVTNTPPNLSVPQVVYTKDETDTTKFPPDFILALSYYLAWVIGPRICRDKKNIIQEVGQRYIGAIRAAIINGAAEEARDDQPLSEFERAREGWPPDVNNFKLFNIP